MSNGTISPAKMINGTRYVSVADLVASRIECESTKTQFDKFCVISLPSGDFRVHQFTWKA